MTTRGCWHCEREKDAADLETWRRELPEARVRPAEDRAPVTLYDANGRPVTTRPRVGFT